MCDANSCYTGCCKNNACVLYASQTDAQCGTGGAQCAACPSGTPCNKTGGICLGCSTAKIVSATSAGLSGNSGDRFGSSVSLSGGNMVVGVPNASSNMGAAIALTGSGQTWAAAGAGYVLPSSDGTANYGAGVGVSGSTIVVSGYPSSACFAFLFTKTGANWFQQGGTLKPPNWTDTPYFPHQGLAIDGSTFVTGGPFGANVYSTSGGSPIALKPSDYTPSSTAGAFGAPAAINGNTILLTGSPKDGSGQAAHWGYVFVKSGSSWTQQAKLVPDDLAANSGPAFRFSVAVQGDIAVLISNFGGYVFTRSGSTWTQSQKLVPPINDGLFGSDVAFSGKLLVIGAANTQGGFGETYVYGLSNKTFVLGPTLKGVTERSPDYFGAAVAVNNGVVVVGAPGTSVVQSSTTNLNQGAVHVFQCTP